MKTKKPTFSHIPPCDYTVQPAVVSYTHRDRPPVTCSRLGKTILAVTYQTAVPTPSLSRLPTHLLDSQPELLTMSDSNTISSTDTTT